MTDTHEVRHYACMDDARVMAQISQNQSASVAAANLILRLGGRLSSRYVSAVGGVNREYARLALRIAQCDRSMLERVANGEISLRHAARLAAESGPACDRLGRAVPDSLHESFGEIVPDLATVAAAVEAAIRTMGRLPADKVLVDVDWCLSRLKAVHSAVVSAAPFAVCFGCRGGGCAACGGRGWITAAMHAARKSKPEE